MIFLKILFTFSFIFILIVAVKSQAGGMLSDKPGIDLEYASAFDQELYKIVIDEKKCDEQLEFLSNNLLFAFQFLDASGKLPTGFLSGNLADLGDYHLCLGIKHVEKNMEIEGKYCMIQYPLKQNQDSDEESSNTTDLPNMDFPDINDVFPNITNIFPLLDNTTLENIKHDRIVQRYAQIISGAGQTILSRMIPANFAARNLMIGTCVPKVCRARQAIDFFQQRFLWITGLRDINMTSDELFCRLPNDKPFSTADYLAVGIFSLIGFVTTMSTFYDLYETFVLKKKTSEINTFYRCCSVYTNTKKFLTFNKVPGAFECVDGIRAISMLWIIVGHTYCLANFTLIQNPKAAQEWLTSFTSTWVNSAPVTVDTFFLLSGILCVYTNKERTSCWRFIKQVHLFYLYRVLRLLPLLAATILLQASVFHRVSDGPMWVNIGHMTAMCRKRWWSALLHMQNYIKPIEICLYHTWYLSVDLQLYFFSPLVLMWLFGRRAVAWCALSTIILIAFVLSTTFSFMYNYPAALINLSRLDKLSDYFVNFYINTLTRAPPFFIGMMYGYLLLQCKGKKIRIRKVSYNLLILHSMFGAVEIQVWIIWILAFLLMAFCIFSTYPIMQEDIHLQMFENFLNSYIRGIWTLAVGWMIFASVHGYGGLINWFLSLQMWKLPSRLSYAMYLTHYPIIMIANSSMVSTYYFADGDTLYRAMANVGFTMIAAFVLSITIDAPCSSLQKLLLGGAMNKPPEKPKVESQGDKDANAKNDDKNTQ